MDKKNKRLGIIAFVLVGIVIVLSFISLIVSNPIGRVIGNFVASGYHFNDYDNDDMIINNNIGSFSGINGRYINSGNGYAADVMRSGGIKMLLDAEISRETDVTLHIKLKANSGKVKVVLVNSNMQKVVTLKEVERGKEDSYEGDVKVHCFSGTNKIKIITDNFSGHFELIRDDNGIFEIYEKKKDSSKDDYKGDSEEHDYKSKSGKMFGDNFPFD